MLSDTNIMHSPPTDVLKDTSQTVDLFVVIDTHADTNISKIQGSRLPAIYYNAALHVLKVGLVFFWEIWLFLLIWGCSSPTLLFLYSFLKQSPHTADGISKGKIRQMGYLASIAEARFLPQSWFLIQQPNSLPAVTAPEGSALLPDLFLGLTGTVLIHEKGGRERIPAGRGRDLAQQISHFTP